MSHPSLIALSVRCKTMQKNSTLSVSNFFLPRPGNSLNTIKIIIMTCQASRHGNTGFPFYFYWFCIKFSIFLLILHYIYDYDLPFQHDVDSKFFQILLQNHTMWLIQMQAWVRFTRIANNIQLKHSSNYGITELYDFIISLGLASHHGKHGSLQNLM